MSIIEFDNKLLPNDKFSVAITGNRSLNEKDRIKIFETMKFIVTNPNVNSIYFGGAVGSDTVALESALNIICLEKPKLIVVVPNMLKDQPKETRKISELADELVELKNVITASDGYRSYQARNEYMVDNVGKDGVVVSFWDKDQSGGTYNCISYALKCGKTVLNVTVEGQK